MTLTIKDLKNQPLLAKADPLTLEKLRDAALVKEISKGEHLFHDKDRVEEVYFVISGNFTLYKLNSLGEKKVIFVLGKNSLLNETIGTDLPTSISVEAFSDAKVIAIPKDLLLELMEEDFGLSLEILKEMEHKIRRLYRQLKNTAGSIRMDKRLASKLWKLSKDHGIPDAKGVRINLPLSNTYLADLLGTQRETISRQMKVLLEEELIIRENQEIIIPSPTQLRKYFQEP